MPSALLLRLLLTLALSLAALAGARAEERALQGVALVIGQSGYQHIPALPNPANDAREVAKLLTDLGFDARSVSDRDAKKLARDLERFVEDAEGADVAFLYYSGHGIEAGGENWLVPVDADVSSLENAGESLVAISAVLDELKATVPVAIVLLDACRTNPFPAGALVKPEPDAPGAPIAPGGLTPVRGAVPLQADAAPAVDNLGTVVGFAAEPGRPALDGAAGGTSPYAAALIRHLTAMQGAEFGAVMRMVTEEVYLDTRAQQRPWVNESLRRLLYFGVAFEPPQGEEALITGERRQLLLTISDLPSLDRKQVEFVAAKEDVSLDALFGVLKQLGAEKLPEDPVELASVLEGQAGRIREMLSQRAALRSDDPEILRLTSAADRALQEGALVAARAFLDKAVARVETTDEAVDAAEEAVKQKRLADAAVYAQRAEAAALAFDFLAAADDFEKAADLADRWDDKLGRQYSLRQGNALLEHGAAKADREALLEARAVFEDAGDRGGADIRRLNRPTILNNVGLTLQHLAELESDPQRLVEAEARFREAAALASENGDDAVWASAQGNLASVLLARGTNEPGTATLEQAIAVYRATLEKQDPSVAPLDRAGTLNNLGIALYTVSEREAHAERLAEAESAYRQALAAYTRDKAPVQWAMVQNNLGNTLNARGSATNDPALFEAAAEAFRNALAVRDRDRMPLQWATTRMNLGTALYNKARPEAGVDLLIEAEAAFRDALSVLDKGRTPLDWAAASNNLGSALQTLGQRQGDVAKLQASADAFRDLLSVYTREKYPLDWAMAHNNLGNSLQLVTVFTQDPQFLAQAADAYRQALLEYRRDTAPRQWALVQASLGATLHSMSNYESGTERLTEAIAARRAALDVLSAETTPLDWATAQNGLGTSLLNLGNRTRDTAMFPQARAAFEASEKVFTREALPLQWAFAENNIGDSHWSHGMFAGDQAELDRAVEKFESAKRGFYDAGRWDLILLVDNKIDLIRNPSK